jgi:hypothetical protein
MSRKSMPKIVLTQGDRKDADRFGDWLSAAGYHVMTCPGPSAPAYRCFMLETSTCPVAATADLLIYDPWLECDSDEADATELVRALRERYHRVPILMVSMQYGFPEGLVRLARTDPDLRLLFRPSRWELDRAVTETLDARRDVRILPPALKL